MTAQQKGESDQLQDDSMLGATGGLFDSASQTEQEIANLLLQLSTSQNQADRERQKMAQESKQQADLIETLLKRA